MLVNVQEIAGKWFWKEMSLQTLAERRQRLNRRHIDRWIDDRSRFVDRQPGKPGWRHLTAWQAEPPAMPTSSCMSWISLVDHAAGYWHDNVICMSVCLSILCPDPVLPCHVELKIAKTDSLTTSKVKRGVPYWRPGSRESRLQWVE